ncbi:uncharacterized protein [Diadema setosum]|uniref:uncharacterized protein n=1 Tax=Diadema setosum TaxID=31175 RepID=UPI003B3AB54C
MHLLHEYNQRKMNVIVFITLMRCLFASSACVTTSNRFRQEPADTFAAAGENVSFTCIAFSFFRDTERLEWLIEPNLYQTKQVDTFNTHEYQMESRLHVFTVGEIDQYFTCILHTFQLHGDADPVCMSSRRAKMTVGYFPSADELTCSPGGEVELRLGEVMTASCEVPRSKPAVDLSLRVEPQANLPNPTVLDTGLQRILRIDLQMEQNMDHMIFFCQVTSPFAFPDRKLECSIGPIRLLRPPQVVVDPQRGEISSSHPLSLVCMAGGYPDVTLYQWSCSPPGILGGCDATSKTVTLSVPGVTDRPTDVRLSHDQTIVVTCSATNLEGTGSNVTRVYYISSSTLTPDDYFQSVGVCLSINNIEVDSSWSTTGVQCSLDPRCSTNDWVYFQWFVNDYEITNNVTDDLVITTSSPYVSSLKFRYLEKSFVSQNVTCKVIFLNSHTKAYTDITMSCNLRGTKVSVSSQDGFDSKSVDQGSNNTMTEWLSVISCDGVNQGNDSNYWKQPVTQGTDTGLNDGGTKMAVGKLVAVVVSGVVAFVILTVCFIALFAKILANRKTKASSPSVAKRPEKTDDRNQRHDKGASCRSSDHVYETPIVSPASEKHDNFAMSPEHSQHTYAVGIEQTERPLSTDSKSSRNSFSHHTYMTPI